MEKYKYFGDVCLDGKIQCEESYKVGLQLYNELSGITSERIKRGKKAKVSWELAHASETALKAFLIYTEFTNMPIFNNPKTINRNSGENKILLRSEKNKNGEIKYIYSQGFYPGYQEHNKIWKKLLDGRRDELSISEQSKFSDGKSFGMIGDPRILLSSIRQYALDGDFRLDSNFMINDPIHSYDFTKTISGHDLFAYLKIQNPFIQGIINNELYLLGNNFSKEQKIIGILEGYGNDIKPDTKNHESISNNSLTFPKRRFDWITGEEISDNDLKELFEFAKINLEIAEFKFPGDDIDKIEYITKLDFSKYNQTIFEYLDPVCKYYVNQYFNSEEINIINNIANNLTESDKNMFVNMCVYYKYYIREKLHLSSKSLNFDELDHAKNLLTYTINLKSYSANSNSKLEDSPTFNQHIDDIKDFELQMKQENKTKETEIIQKHIEYLKNKYDIGKINLENIEEYYVPRVCRECAMENEMLAFMNSIPGHEVLNTNMIGITEPLHYTSFFGFNTEKGPKWYIVDPTYGQFYENKEFKNYMLNHYREFSTEILEKGYIEVTLSNILSYINGFTLSRAYTNEIDIEKVYLNIRNFLSDKKILNKNNIYKLDEIIGENFNSKQQSK